MLISVTANDAEAAGAAAAKVSQSKYLKGATAAARRKTPNAVVSDLRVAEGFAVATVKDPTGGPQARSGNLAVFKVRRTGSMRQLAIGSSFDPLSLVELGVPLTAQAKLTWSGPGTVQQALSDACGYHGGSAPGYSGFGASFKPDGWQIDALSLDLIEQRLTDTLSNSKAGKAVICVRAGYRNSNVTADPKTYISTFTLRLFFVASDGTVTRHTFTWDNATVKDRTYTLDGHEIS